MSALHWLDRAARQQNKEAWQLIGEHIPFETARHAGDIPTLLMWYGKAFNAGSFSAGVTLARLVIKSPEVYAAWYGKAMHALQIAAEAGNAEAQWLLAQQTPESVFAHAAPAPMKTAPHVHAGKKPMTPLEWAASAADAGIPAARHVLAERAWATADYAAFLHWSLPLAREVMQRYR